MPTLDQESFVTYLSDRLTQAVAFAHVCDATVAITGTLRSIREAAESDRFVVVEDDHRDGVNIRDLLHLRGNLNAAGLTEFVADIDRMRGRPVDVETFAPTPDDDETLSTASAIRTVRDAEPPPPPSLIASRATFRAAQAVAAEQRSLLLNMLIALEDPNRPEEAPVDAIRRLKNYKPPTPPPPLALEVCRLLVMVNEDAHDGEGPYTIDDETGLNECHAQDRILTKAYAVVAAADDQAANEVEANVLARIAQGMAEGFGGDAATIGARIPNAPGSWDYNGQRVEVVGTRVLYFDHVRTIDQVVDLWGGPWVSAVDLTERSNISEAVARQAGAQLRDSVAAPQRMVPVYPPTVAAGLDVRFFGDDE